MSEEESQEFISSLRASNTRLERIEADLFDCLVYAMHHVKQFAGNRWFGPLIGGTFFMCRKDWVWIPDSLPSEAMGSITAEFGEQLTRGLTYP